MPLSTTILTIQKAESDLYDVILNHNDAIGTIGSSKLQEEFTFIPHNYNKYKPQTTRGLYAMVATILPQVMLLEGIVNEIRIEFT